MKKLIFHSVVIFAAMYSPVLAADVLSDNEIAAGKAIFDRLCVNCHRMPSSIQTATTELQARLSSGTIRQHRFQLSGDELVQVTAYIKSVRP